MADIEEHDSDNSDTQNNPAESNGAQSSSTGQIAPSEPPAASRVLRSSRAASRTQRRDQEKSPPPTRRTPPSPASSYTSVQPTIPAIAKWTVLGLRLALNNADIPFARRINKADLYGLYCSNLQHAPSHKPASQAGSTPSPNQTRKSPYRTRPASQQAFSQPESTSRFSRKQPWHISGSPKHKPPSQREPFSACGSVPASGF